MYTAGKTMEELLAKPMAYIAGVDGAGRRPLAGPAIAAAAILPVRHSV